MRAIVDAGEEIAQAAAKAVADRASRRTRPRLPLRHDPDRWRRRQGRAQPQRLHLRRPPDRSQPDRQRRLGAHGAAGGAAPGASRRRAPVRELHRCGLHRNRGARGAAGRPAQGGDRRRRRAHVARDSRRTKRGLSLRRSDDPLAARGFSALRPWTTVELCARLQRLVEIVDRSPASSTPTDRRSRSGGHGVPGPSMLARCSIRLSTPPSDVARFHSSTRAAVAIAARSPPLHAHRQHAAEAARHLLLAPAAWPAKEGRPG